MGLFSACVEMKLHKHCTAVCIVHSAAVKQREVVLFTELALNEF